MGMKKGKVERKGRNEGWNEQRNGRKGRKEGRKEGRKDYVYSCVRKREHATVGLLGKFFFHSTALHWLNLAQMTISGKITRVG